MKENLKIRANISVFDSISALVEGRKKVLFIVDDENHLLGLFTNGDMRKYLLKSNDLTVSISNAMNKKPKVFLSKEEALNYSNFNKLVVFPIVNGNNILIDAVFQNEETNNQILNEDLSGVPLIIMAGGKGTRLYPYTKVLPKALIPIGEYTISERIIHSFFKYGCKEVFFVLNHKANMIKAYFNDLEKAYELNYVEESNFLGTCGGLKLLENNIKTTFIVSNCDILIDDDLSCAYRTHKLNDNKITMISSMKTIEIPYGIVNTDHIGNLTTMTEKPKLSYLVNTGVYIIEPELLELIKSGENINLPDFVNRCKNNNKKIGVFPISENAWMDMGQTKELESMKLRIEREL